MCVVSSNAAAARGDAAQASFDRKLSHYRNEISELRNQGIHYRPLVWTADGRQHPAITRTLQYAADIASGRNGQQMSAESIQRRWKHEFQIALLRPKKSSSASRVALRGIIDRTLHHWGHVTPLDGGPHDHDHATPRLTQQYRMTTMTSPPSSVNRSDLSSHNPLVAWFCPHGAACPCS